MDNPGDMVDKWKELYPTQFLAIHLGTWKSRVMVVCPPTRLEKLHLMQFIHYPLHHPHRGSLQQTYDDYYGRKDWPSHGYPLDDDGPDYDADDRGQHQSCQPVPLRYGFYLLAKEYGKASIQHPIAQDLAFYDCPELRRKLYSGLVTMLRMIREVSENDPTSEGLNADRELGNICLTIPAQWDSSFQKVYLDALAAAFDYQPETLREKVMFITEPDALVHVIYGCLTHKPTPMNRQPQIELFLNFGTHTTDGSMFWVGPQEVNGPTTVRTRFFRMGDPFGVPGGWALCFHYAMESIDDSFFSREGRPLSARERLHITSKLKLSGARKWGPNYRSQGTCFSILTDGPAYKTVEISISDQEIRHCWESAYRPSLRVVAQQFALFKKIRTETSAPGLVYVTGQDLWRSRPLEAELENLARQAGITNFQIEESCAVFGAIRAAEMKLTVEQFIIQGVGIGLQKKLPGTSQWEDDAALLCYYDINTKEYQRSRSTSAQPQVEGTQFRLLCNPLYHVIPPKNSQSEKPPNKAMKTPIKSYQSYVLFEDMPTVQQRGKYVCHVAFEGSGDEMFLLVNVEQGRPSTTKTAELRLRLRYNPVPRRAEAFLEPAEGDGEDEDMEEAA